MCQSLHLVDFRFHDYAQHGRLARHWTAFLWNRSAMRWVLTVKITEQHYAQIHPDYREKAREYAKRTLRPYDGQ